VYRFDEHTARMMDSARAMGFKNIPTKEYIRDAVLKTLQGECS
jgi:branched-subunit amino acid aminotransferase/4-amino-4-deoxychorismate lyase